MNARELHLDDFIIVHDDGEDIILVVLYVAVNSILIGYYHDR